MQLHLILPGLLWPSPILRDTLYDLDLPNLAWLTGRATSHWHPPTNLENHLCHLFGIDHTPAPLAALRQLSETTRLPSDDPKAYWICADLASLSFERNRMQISTQDLQVSAAEMAHISAVLSPLFQELGEFHSSAEARGYLRLTHLPEIRTTPPSAAHGPESLLPEGPEAALWRRLGNEAQMQLHTLALNAQRAAQGKPALNALWFWGAGQLPRPQNAPYSQVYGSHPVLKGLAAWAHVPAFHTAKASQLQAQLQGLLQGQLQRQLTKRKNNALLVIEDLLPATQQRDAMAWRAALQDIEREVLEVLQRALCQGQLRSLRITALGDEARLELQVHASARFKFWRSAQSFHEFVGAQQATKTAK